MKGDTSGGHNGSIERVCMEGPVFSEGGGYGGIRSYKTIEPQHRSPNLT